MAYREAALLPNSPLCAKTQLQFVGSEVAANREER